MHVWPADPKGERQASGLADLATAFAGAKPGDRVLLHAGAYVGPFRPSACGAPEHPIIFRPAGDGEVILTNHGDDTASVVETQPGSNCLYFEKLTVRGGRAGIRGIGVRGTVVRQCRLYDVLYGISTGTEVGKFECQDWHVADNLLTGRDQDRRKYVKDHYGAGINIAGRGHVVCHDRVGNFWDDISTDHVEHPSRSSGLSSPTAPRMPSTSTTTT